MAVKFQDYYEILGVPRTASHDEIHKAYRKLARRYHPDVNKTREAEEKFKQIGEAYEVLGDQEKRKRYDTLGSDWRSGEDFTPPPGWESFSRQNGGGESFHFESFGSPFDGGSFSDFFETLFGGGFGATAREDARQTRRPSARAADQEADITIPLEEAYAGARKQLALQIEERLADGRTRRSTRNLEVTIPEGIADGKKLRLSGQGQHGGDLYLRVHVEAKAPFRVNGADIEVDVPVSPWEAALGAKIDVPLVGGTVALTLPAGISPRQKLRLKGKGLVKRAGERADLYAVIVVTVPKHLSAEERRLFEELARVSRYRPRER